MDTQDGQERCAKSSSHKLPHRTPVRVWSDDDKSLGLGVMEWTTPRGIGGALFVGLKKQKKRK